MVAANIVIAIIIIVLFATLIGVGFLIWFLQSGFNKLAKGGSDGSSDGDA